jgi:Flp pilus assembly protein TadG
VTGRLRRWRADGAAYVEFLIVMPPLLLLFFGLAQLGLLYGAELLVQHAAARAVRAAIVVLPDDDEGADYAGDAVNSVGGSGEGLEAYGTAAPGGRLEAIRTAARLTLAPLSPALGSGASDSIAGALGAGLASSAAGLLGFTRWTVAVTFPDGEGGYRTAFEPRGDVTARVTFLYRCAVPLARALLCDGWAGLGEGARERLSTTGGGVALAAAASGWRFAALEAERTMPNQGR